MEDGWGRVEISGVLTALQSHSLFPFPTSGGRKTEKLKCFNRLLSAVLQEYKGRCEGLSMQLGQREAEATALRLALQYRSVHPTVIHCLGKTWTSSEDSLNPQRETEPSQKSICPCRGN